MDGLDSLETQGVQQQVNPREDNHQWPGFFEIPDKQVGDRGNCRQYSEEDAPPFVMAETDYNEGHGNSCVPQGIRDAVVEAGAGQAGEQDNRTRSPIVAKIPAGMKTQY